MNRITNNHILNYLPLFFVFVFVYTASSKLIEPELFQNTISKSPLIGDQAHLLAIAVPIVELIIAALLLVPATKTIGAWATLIVMTLFTAYIAYMILYTPHLPCSCGGVIKSLSWPQHLAFNILLLCLAVLQVLSVSHTTIRCI